MNLNDIGSLSLNDLGDLIKEAKSTVDNRMSELTDSEKLSVNNIVKGVDTSNIKDLEVKIAELKNNKDA